MSGDAGQLLEQLSDELTAVEEAIRSHRFLALLEEGGVPRERLGAFAGEQSVIIASDRRAFAQLAARFPQPPAGDVFLTLAQGEGEALARLRRLARWLLLEEHDLHDYEPQPGAQAYTAFVAWLALNGSRSDVAAAFLANLAAWGANCARMAGALRGRYQAPDEAVAFFEFFARPAPDLEQGMLAVLDAGLAGGDSAQHARRAARLLQAYELLFWDTLAARLESTE